MFLAGMRSKERDWIAHREIPVCLAVGQVARNLVSIPLQRPEVSYPPPWAGKPMPRARGTGGLLEKLWIARVRDFRSLQEKEEKRWQAMHDVKHVTGHPTAGIVGGLR